MFCPYCKANECKVIDSRSTLEGNSIRRRRECLSCSRRFTTYESVEIIPKLVIKKDSSRQNFDRDKLVAKLLRAFGKRPVSFEILKNIVIEIENDLFSSAVQEVESYKIAELAMKKLKDIDIVAYIRFVSVYREFSSIEEFMDELNDLDSV